MPVNSSRPSVARPSVEPASRRHAPAAGAATKRRAAPARPRETKGQQTRSAIVAAALDLASLQGLEGLTIGALAERMTMSKSGVFAHFGSREELQIAVLTAYGQRFADDVLREALKQPRGLPRLAAILHRWVDRTVIEASHGCIWISGASEYDDRPGPVRDALVTVVLSWRAELQRAIEQAIQAGHLRPDTDVEDLTFDINGAILVLHHDARLMHRADAAAQARRSVARTLARYHARPGGG